MTAQAQMLHQARLAMSRGDLGQAKMLCERLISESKKNAEAMYIMGGILFTERRLDESAAYLERAAGLAPKNPPVHLLFAQVQRMRGRYQSALRHVDRVLRLKPDSIDAIYIKAEVLDARGDHDKLRRILEPLAEQRPDDDNIAYYVALCHDAAKELDPAIDVLRKHLAGTAATSVNQRRMGYLLGRMLEKRRDYDDAFEAFRVANAVDRVEADPDEFCAEVDEYIDVFSPRFLETAPRAAHGLDQPILIVGLPRTGSTLIERILDQHPQVHGAGESAAMAHVVEELPLRSGSTFQYPRCVRYLDQETVEEAGREYVDHLRTSGGRAAKRLVDKNLSNYQSLGLLSLVVPGARVIDCRREAVNTCIACYSAPLDPRGYPYIADLEHLGLFYRQYRRLMRHWEAVLDLKMMTIQYEEMVADQEGMTRRLLEFCDLPWNDRCLRFHESTRAGSTLSAQQVRQPIYRSSLSRADHYAPHLEPLIAALGDEVDRAAPSETE